jgi:hypothetical protein
MQKPTICREANVAALGKAGKRLPHFAPLAKTAVQRLYYEVQRQDLGESFAHKSFVHKMLRCRKVTHPNL